MHSVDTAFEQHKEYTLSKIRRKRDRRRPAGNGEQPAARDVDAQQSGAEREDAAEEKKREDEVSHVSQHTDAFHPPHPPSRSRAQSISRAAPHQSIVRDVLKQVLPALLQQQQALMGSAFSAMGSSAAVDSNGEDGALSYGYRNCDTLQRQVDELRAEVERLKAAASAAASESHRAVSPDVKEDGVAQGCSPTPNDSDADRTARRHSSPAASPANNRADTPEVQKSSFVDDSQPADESTSNYAEHFAEQPSAPATMYHEEEQQQQQQQQYGRASAHRNFTPDDPRRCVWVQSRYSIQAAELGEVMSHFRACGRGGRDQVFCRCQAVCVCVLCP